MNTPLFSHQPSPIIQIKSDLLEQYQVQVLIKRDDLLQPTGDQAFCGNKVRKLKYNLEAARSTGHHQLLTFGGAYSNHIAAVAKAGKSYGFQTIGVIRGEVHAVLNPTLAQAVKDGMTLHYLDRVSYRQKSMDAVRGQLKEKFGDFYLIPEGGTNDLAIKGCHEIIYELENQLDVFPDYLAVACGTGGTIAGIIQACAGRGQVIGVSALKGDFMSAEVRNLLGPDFPHSNWGVQCDFHFGGYAKFPAELRNFVQKFKQEHGIVLDPIYTSKLVFGIFSLVQRNFFKKGVKIVIVHSGGLQGWKGIRL